VVSLAAPPADTRPKVAVLDLQPNGTSPQLAAAVGGAVATELERLGAFRVLTSEGLRSMLALERQYQMLGCDTGTCLEGIGAAVGAEYLVHGSVIQIDTPGEASLFRLDLTLSQTAQGVQAGAINESAASAAELMQLLPRAITRLTTKVLATRTGQLRVVSNEAGALVKLDDQARGTTPLPAPLAVPSGPRTLLVEKQGFVSWQADLVVVPGKTQIERITLVPSPDYVVAYERKAGRMRWGAWAATGVAAAGAVTAVVFQLKASDLYGNTATPGSFLYYKQKLLDGATPPAGEDYRASGQKLSDQMKTAENISYIAGGAAVVAGGVAIWLWVAGDDPSRYASSRTTVSLVPSPGGATLALAGGF
jgi:hypothetical protein